MKESTNAHEKGGWRIRSTWFVTPIVVLAALILMLLAYAVLHGPAH